MAKVQISPGNSGASRFQEGATGETYTSPQQRIWSGDLYQCKETHISAAANQPPNGASWETYWELVIDALPESADPGSIVHYGEDRKPVASKTGDIDVNSVTASQTAAAASIVGDAVEAADETKGFLAQPASSVHSALDVYGEGIDGSIGPEVEAGAINLVSRKGADVQKITHDMIAGVVAAAPTAEDPLVKQSASELTDERQPIRYLIVAAAEAATGLDNDICYVVETETWYRTETSAGSYTRDGTFVLNTGAGGNTRLLGIAGRYVHQGSDSFAHSTYYAASGSFGAPTIVLPADRRSLLTPTDGGLKIGGSFFRWSSIPNIDVDVAANWDDSQYATAATRAGLNPILYLCQHAGQLAPDFVFSMNASFPAGYNANTSRKIGGGHALCLNAGTIAGHPLSGYLTGDLIPPSIWDLLLRPDCSNPAGMVHLGWAGLTLKAPGWWTDIYLTSGTGANTASAFAATILDTVDWNTCVDHLATVGKLLLNDWLFQVVAAGSNEETNIYGSQDPVKTGLIGTKVFTGAGLNDLTLDRTAWSHVTGAQEYEGEIDATGTPDTFKHRKRNLGGTWGSYTTGVPIVAGPIVIADGLTVAFGATTGHTLGNKWNLNVMDAGFDTAGRRMISHSGIEMVCGASWQWLLDQSYRFDGAASHTHAHGDPTSGPPSGDVAPAWDYYNLPGAKGSLYRQGTYGDIKLLAGGSWYDGSGCGSRSRGAYYYRWYTSSALGARGCARSQRT